MNPSNCIQDTRHKSVGDFAPRTLDQVREWEASQQPAQAWSDRDSSRGVSKSTASCHALGLPTAAPESSGVPA